MLFNTAPAPRSGATMLRSVRSQHAFSSLPSHRSLKVFSPASLNQGSPTKGFLLKGFSLLPHPSSLDTSELTKLSSPSSRHWGGADVMLPERPQQSCSSILHRVLPNMLPLRSATTHLHHTPPLRAATTRRNQVPPPHASTTRCEHSPPQEFSLRELLILSHFHSKFLYFELKMRKNL